MEEWIYDGEIDEARKRPAMTVYGLNELSIPLVDYMLIALRLAEKCGIQFKIEENEDRYRLDFYLHGSTVIGPQISEWCSLIGGSQLYTLTVQEWLPQTVRASFYRAKEKQEPKLPPSDGEGGKCDSDRV